MRALIQGWLRYAWSRPTSTVVMTCSSRCGPPKIRSGVAPIGVGSGPVGVAVTPDGTRAYITNRYSNTVSVIDTATNTVIGRPIAVEVSGPCWPTLNSIDAASCN